MLNLNVNVNGKFVNVNNCIYKKKQLLAFSVIALIVICYFLILETENVIIDGTEITRTIFGPTKKMSTYLVAFVVSDFKYINAKDKKGILVGPLH